MARIKSVWYCSECGNKQTKWSGQCSQCSGWNTFQEEKEGPAMEQRYEGRDEARSTPKRLNEISSNETPRIPTGIAECDRLMGGGVVRGSLSLIGGDPGIGKSTLMLQLSNALANQGLTVLYVCGEESIEQTGLRAKRLGIHSERVLLLAETSFAQIKHQIGEIKPDILIIDSIQIVYKNELSSAPGSVSQVREIATECMHIAKGKNIATFLIGHVTKSGEIAGPRVLEHIVDTVFYFEGDQHHNYRMIRVVKNRFGSTDEVAVFQMGTGGLSEVPNPSKLFLEQRLRGVPGSVIVPTIEGSRPILIEAQALVTETPFPTPTRRCTGLDQNRLALLLAVLEKRMKYPLFRCDVFVSIAGGMRIIEPAIDIGLLLAVASSFRNKSVDNQTAIFGEVGLSGEVRAVPRVESRIKEAAQMGFTKCLIPKGNAASFIEKNPYSIAIKPITLVEEAIHELL